MAEAMVSGFPSDDDAIAAPPALSLGLDPGLQIELIILEVARINDEYNIPNSFDTKLSNALDAFYAENANRREDLPNKLASFINSVQAQAGKKILEEDADLLIEMAQAVIDSL